IDHQFTATQPCDHPNTNCVQTITVTDTTPPTFTFCPASTNIDCTASTNVTNTGNATATDDCSGPVTVTHSDTVTAGNCPGNYTTIRRASWTERGDTANS